MELVANASPSPPRENLWDLAASQLSDKYKACINFSSTVKLDDLLVAVKDKKEECQKKQWTVERGPGRNPIVLRDVFTKIATWIEKFVECGDCAVQYDPGHAALPWAAVRFLLKVSVTDVQQYAVVVAGLETVSNVITRYEIMQKLYLEEETQAKGLLQSSIVTLYNKILVFLCKAHRHYSRSSAKRLMKNILAFQDKFQAVLGGISQQDKMNQDYVVLVEGEIAKKRTERLGVLSADDSVRWDDLRRQLSKLQQPINRMEQQLRDIQDRLNGTERLDVLQWLSTVPYKKHHEQTRKDILSGTGTWLYREQQLLDWQVSSVSSIMWLHGAPGSGKSKLVSMLIDRFIDDFEADRNPNPIYFYCQRNSAEPERSDPEAILRSLVRQISCLRPGSALLQPVLELYNERKKEGFAAGSLDSHECTALILKMTKDRPMTIIVIDALDECDPEKRGVLLEALSMIVDNSIGLVKLFISSRDDQDIVLHLGKGPNLKIQASHNQNDIIKYVNNEVDKMIHSSKWRSGEVNDKLKHEVKSALIEKAQGMFLWVTMQLEFLCSLRLPSLVKKRLGALPPNLLKIYDENYSQQFKSYQKEERRIVENAFRFLLCAQEKLSTRGFLKALSVLNLEDESLSPNLLLDLCFNFVDIDTQLDVFRFAHLSVREYLESKSDYERNSNHALAAECCVRLLSSDEEINRHGAFGDLVTEDVSESEDTLPVQGAPDMVAESEVEGLLQPELASLTHSAFWNDSALVRTDFHSYACIHWAFHLASSGDFRMVSPLKDHTYAFMMDHQHSTSNAYRVWTMDAFQHWPVLVPMDNMEELLAALGTDTGPPSPDYLFVACVWGFDDLLQIRIRAARKPANGQVIHDSGRALFTATTFGNYTAVRLLLEYGADLEWKNWWDRTALCESVVAKWPRICQILLYKGADHGTGDWESKRPLTWAVEKRDLEITRMLLRHGAGVDIEDHGDTINKPLRIAVTSGEVEIARTLLQHGADPDRGVFYSPLSKAVGRKDVAMVRVLLEYGASPKLFCKGYTPPIQRGEQLFPAQPKPGLLAAAVSTGHLDIIRILIENGADINEAGLLKKAIQTGKADIVRVLLDNGAELNKDYNWYGSPLWHAAKRGNLEMLKMLFNCGFHAPTECKSSEGKKYPLSLMLKHFNADAVELLKQHGCSFEDEVEFEEKD